jgi:hypothetical protein
MSVMLCVCTAGRQLLAIEINFNLRFGLAQILSPLFPPSGMLDLPPDQIPMIACLCAFGKMSLQGAKLFTGIL